MQAERKTKKNKSIRDALPREGERNVTDAFLQQKIPPPVPVIRSDMYPVFWTLAQK